MTTRIIIQYKYCQIKTNCLCSHTGSYKIIFLKPGGCKGKYKNKTNKSSAHTIPTN